MTVGVPGVPEEPYAPEDRASREAPANPPRTLVGIDGSWPARAALQWAARHARATQSVVCAVHVLEWPVGFQSDSPPRAEPTLHVPDAEVAQSYRDGMSRIFDEVEPLPAWRLTFAEGPTAQMLVQLVEDADLLVIGSRENAFSGDARIGDTGHYCASHSRRPVVIVPVEYLKSIFPAPRDAPPTGDRTQPG
jgi:nucleotide-binding universal stress UspA family protein